MAENIIDGGAAFPRDVWDDVPGMSLRDWFAGRALNGLLSTSAEIYDNDWDAVTAKLARFSYDYADAMLAAREAR